MDGDLGGAYAVVEALAASTGGLLLLTATPEQLGIESHLARLRLLDPDRYADLDSLASQSAQFVQIAEIAVALEGGGALDAAQRDFLAGLPGMDVDNMPGEVLLSGLLDRHGPGRVIFRNTRASVKGFPPRVAHLHPLEPSDMQDAALERDPRVLWLVDWLKSNAGEKALVICQTQALAIGLEAALRTHTSVRCGVFHEELSLIQRDRNAAWFAEPDGARLLICSEIGSEGRNFQFVQHLVLFDLPENPELLEQRIGRLDRIGQKGAVQVHVPYLCGGPDAVLAHWYHEGLDAFEHTLPAAGEMLRRFGGELAQHCAQDGTEELSIFLSRVRNTREALCQQMESGRDRLLELASHNPRNSQRIADAIRDSDLDTSPEELLLDVLDVHDVSLEPLGPRTYSIDNRRFSGETFPGLPRNTLVGTFDRSLALARDDLHLLGPDHPVFEGAIEMLLTGGAGSCSYGVWEDATESTLLLEAIFVLEALAPPHLHVERFLPPTPLRLVIGPDGTLLDTEVPKLQPGTPHTLLEQSRIRKNLLPAMLASAEKHAERLARGGQADAAAQMRRKLQSEVDRLLALRKVNPDVRESEIQLALEQMEQLSDAITQARIRLDAVRLVWKGFL